MDLDIPDTSSDSSNDTLIVSNKQKDDVSKSVPNELDNLFRKYLGDSYSIKNKNFEDDAKILSDDNELLNTNFPSTSTIKLNKKDSSKHLVDVVYCVSEDDEDIDFPSFAQAKRYKQDSEPPLDSLKTDSNETLANSHGLKQSVTSFEDNDLIPDVVKKQKNSKGKVIEKENLRQQKLLERERKKEEEKRNKALKESLASYYKDIKPENCLKFIKTHISEEISKKEYSQDIVTQLQNNSVSFTIESNIVPSTISWTRQINNHILGLDGKLIGTSKGMKIEEILLIMSCHDFLTQVHNNTFVSQIENTCITLKENKLILAIYGLQQYYRFQKNKKSQDFREEVSSKTYKNLKDEKKIGNLPVVSRRTVEYALTEIQLLYSISHRLVESSAELGLLVFQLTKSIAQVPYKLGKQEKLMQKKWLMSEDNKNCIRVDKNGNGLSRLWKQMITTFPLATLETSEAITAVYPTPLCLFKAYENIQTVTEGAKLLQDIPIRRNAGPISIMRKIGPELSKKMHNFLTSLDPDKVL